MKLYKKLDRPACAKCRGTGMVKTGRGLVSDLDIACLKCGGTGLP